MGVTDWSKIANDNGTTGDSAFPEGQTPGSLNDGSRAIKAEVAQFRDDTGGQLTTAGASGVYTLTTNQTLNALADGQRLSFVANHANTGSSTLNVDGLGAKALRQANDKLLEADAILADAHYDVQYDASANSGSGAWLLLNAHGLSLIGQPTEFTASGTFNPSDATVFLIVEGVGAGGGGGGASAAGSENDAGGGAGAGEEGEVFIASPATSYTVTIGAHGAGGAAGANGADGGNTSFGTALVLNGGKGGTDSTSAAVKFNNGGDGGISGTGDRLKQGNPGGWGFKATTSNRASGSGGSGKYGAGGRGQVANGAPASLAGNDASGYGAGGGGAVSSTTAGQTGGDGTDGYIRVWEYK